MSLSNLVQLGGKALTKNSKNQSKNFTIFFILGLFDLLIRAIIIFWGYNTLMPKFIITLSSSPNNIKNFREISYGEALILVIVVQCLIG
jgi:hypothetical protein